MGVVLFVWVAASSEMWVFFLGGGVVLTSELLACKK